MTSESHHVSIQTLLSGKNWISIKTMAKMLGMQTNFWSYIEWRIKAKVQTFPVEEEVSSPFFFSFLFFSKYKHILKIILIISGAYMQV